MGAKNSLAGLTVVEIRDGLRNGDFTVGELVDDHIHAAERAKNLNGYIIYKMVFNFYRFIINQKLPV